MTAARMLTVHASRLTALSGAPVRAVTLHSAYSQLQSRRDCRCYSHHAPTSVDVY